MVVMHTCQGTYQLLCFLYCQYSSWPESRPFFPVRKLRLHIRVPGFCNGHTLYDWHGTRVCSLWFQYQYACPRPNAKKNNRNMSVKFHLFTYKVPKSRLTPFRAFWLGPCSCEILLPSPPTQPRQSHKRARKWERHGYPFRCVNNKLSPLQLWPNVIGVIVFAQGK